MAANAKTEPKWKKIVRRLAGRPTPFWGKRLEDRLEHTDPITRELSEGWDYLGRAVWRVITRLLVGAGLLTLLAVVIQWIFASPDFLRYGLADSIGRGLAAVCVGTGRCDLPGLLAGTALAVPMLVVITFMLTAAFHSPELVDDDDDEPSNDEVLNWLNLVDERIVRLRAEFVLAGVLPPSLEEKEELDARLTDAEQI